MPMKNLETGPNLTCRVWVEAEVPAKHGQGAPLQLLPGPFFCLQQCQPLRYPAATVWTLSSCETSVFLNSKTLQICATLLCPPQVRGKFGLPMSCLTWWEIKGANCHVSSHLSITRGEPFKKRVSSIYKVYCSAHTSKIIWNIDSNGISSRLSWWLWRETQIIQDYFKPPCVSDQSNESRSSQRRRLLRFQEEIIQKENVTVSSGWTFKSKEAPLSNLEYRTFIIKRRVKPFLGQFLLKNKKTWH